MKKLPASTYAELLYRAAAGQPSARRKVVVKTWLELIRRHRAMRLMPRILHHLQRLDDLAHQRTRVAVTIPTDTSTKTLERLLADTLGPVAIDLTVDPALQGGLVLRVGDDEIDASLRTRLHQLHHQLSNA